ncbi:phenylacetate-CoA ligase [Amycolatopsis pretoriensis]|uniref:Phenylacetate-CoA ligase n=1 Tax=Amycolatopsis pretoriensis TaxID=218821 RepID=A0A1H5QDL8_9PSEU|nr:AMP-binding protein [Amycolatopsis pretoriensis]SEF23491.1 phenylacetate-CoA ligase [Amycolatopsis pretoriensis]
MHVPRKLASRAYWQSQRMRGRSAVHRRLEELRANQHLPAEVVDARQFEKLQSVVAHAYRTVPYYRQVMDKRGMREITSPSDLRELPLLTRDVLAREQAGLLSETADRATLQANYSSGSTGRRAEFRQDLDFRMWMRAHQLRTYEWCAGWQLGDPFVLLWGSEIYWSFKQTMDRLENLATNRREFNTFRLSPELITTFLNKLVEFEPALISTYSNAMHLIAKGAERLGRTIPGLQAVQGTSEPLPPALRARIGDVLGCQVYDKYGMRETNIIAHEQPGGGPMLIQSENVYVEFLDDDGEPCAPGQTGRIVVTTLNNRSMPLLRYETSDLAAPLLRDPAAPLPYPAMTTVAGRLQDLILTPSGDHVDAYLFSYLFMRFPEVDWFQVVQREPDRLDIRIYAPGGLGNRTTAELVDRIQHHTGYPFDIAFEPLERMPESSTGKFRLCVSELDPATRKGLLTRD